MQLFHRQRSYSKRQEHSLESIDIIWICREPPDVTETIFSHKFCRETSRELCREKLNLSAWMDIFPKADKDTKEPSSDSRDALFPREMSNLSNALADVKADYCLIVSNPELVISPAAVTKMINTLEKGYSLCLPVYNETDSSCQGARLPAVYLNLSTYLEVADMMTKQNKIKLASLSDSDTSCVLLTREFLKSMDIKSLPHRQDKIENTLTLICSACEKGQSVVDHGALIHSFGNYFNYYSGEREDLAKLVPESAKFILDVGCANGGFGEVMRKKTAGLHLTGVEMNPVMAEHAALHYDKIFCEKIENVDFDMLFDHINCGDIIEHLYNPWKMLELFHSLLKKGGTFVTSLPNAGHWTIVRDLANGEFVYLPVGLLCVTHIRWFTENSIKKALTDAGFTIDSFEREQIPPTPQGLDFINYMCKSGKCSRESLLTNEFTIRAVKK